MLPLIFSLGNVNISPLGIFLALAFLLTVFAFWRSCRDTLSNDNIFDLLFSVMTLGIVFSRLQYVLLHWDKFNSNWLRVFLFLRYPGFSFLFGLVSAIIIILLFSHRRRFSFLFVLDRFSIGLTLGILFCSIGFFLSGTGAGVVTKFPLGFYFPGYIGARHPLSLYEAVIMLFLLCAFYFIGRRYPNHQEGILISLFTVILGVSLFLLEFLRFGDVYSISSIRIGHILGLFLMAGGIIFLSRKGFFTLLVPEKPALIQKLCRWINSILFRKKEV